MQNVWQLQDVGDVEAQNSATTKLDTKHKASFNH
jgi:hypothetical protein